MDKISTDQLVSLMSAHLNKLDEVRKSKDYYFNHKYAAYQNTHSTGKIKTFLENEDTLAGPHIFIGQFKW